MNMRTYDTNSCRVCNDIWRNVVHLDEERVSLILALNALIPSRAKDVIAIPTTTEENLAGVSIVQDENRKLIHSGDERSSPYE